MRIAICGEVHSGNLGDGIIFDSLRHLVNKVDDEIEVVPLDLTGRRGPAAAGPGPIGPMRRLNRALLDTSATYRRLMARVVWARSGADVVEHIWKPVLRDVDLVVLGGGNLLIDNDLNFPLRVRSLSRCAREMGRPFAVLACGVGRRWSSGGQKMLSEALDGAVWMGVRDRPSLGNLARLTSRSESAMTVAPDPGVWAGEVYGIHHNPDAAVTGFGIAAPSVLCRHTPGGGFDDERLLDFWSDLYRKVRKSGREVVLFGNGAIEDHEFALRIADVIAANGQTAPRVLDRPEKPEALVRMIADFDAVVAHRLHANVVAYSLGIPAVGLGWDEKLRAFGEMSGRAEYVTDGDQTSNAGAVADMLYAARVAKTNMVAVADHKEQAALVVADMLAYISSDTERGGA